MSLESVINECNSEIIIENKIIDQASKLLSLKNVWPGKSYLILVSENMVTEVMLYSRLYLVFFFIPPVGLLICTKICHFEKMSWTLTDLSSLEMDIYPKHNDCSFIKGRSTPITSRKEENRCWAQNRKKQTWKQHEQEALNGRGVAKQRAQAGLDNEKDDTLIRACA